MNVNKCFHSAVCSFLVVGLFAALFHDYSSVMRGQTNQPTSISTTLEWLKNMLIDNVLHMWQFNQVPISDQIRKPHAFGVSPNLSTCHESYINRIRNTSTYCCPPNSESNENVIDFQFPDPSAPKRIRRPAHKLDKDYIEKYTKALTRMKDLPDKDPRNYYRQANIHCTYCTGAYYQKNENIQLNVHASWLFFPWHRMLLYFHERILANLIGDETFSLPFWNWDAPEGMTLPDLYYNVPFVDTNRSLVHTCPNKIVDLHYNISSNCSDNNKPANIQISENLIFMYKQMVSGAKKAELFMGGAYKPDKYGNCQSAGTLETAPHNTVHDWVGKESSPNGEDMGVLYAAARDPVFWAHHSNVDRLWEVWKNLTGNESEIVEQDWLDSYFYFHDEQSHLVRIKIRDVLNITKLGYSYEHVALPWNHTRPKPSTDPGIARRDLNTRNTSLQSSDFRPSGRWVDNNIMVKVDMPRTEKGKEKEVVLVVYGIDVQKDVFVKFDVYVNAIDAASIGPESTEFAGTYVRLPRGVKKMNERDKRVCTKMTLKLGISELLQDLQASEEDFIWVTLVPRRGTGIHIRVDGIRIE